MYRIGWLSTGRDKAARDLLTTVQKSIEKGRIKANIFFVFSNHKLGESKESDLFFEPIKSYNTPLVFLSSQKYKDHEPSIVMSS